MPCPALTVPLTPSQAPSRLHCPLGLSSGLFGSHCPSGPTSGAARPSVFPLASPQALSGPHCPLSPCWAAQQPIQGSPSPRPRSVAASPPPGHQPPWSSSPILPSSSFPHRRLDTHYSLSSTMSLRGSAAARFPPASRRPLSPWPGPARLPVRLRRGLLCPRRSRCGRRAGSCAPASPPPALLPTPPGAPVPQRRAGAGRLCGNQSVTRSGAR